MDYEKKYKEALSWIKDVYPTFEGAVKEDAEHYFPELKESEDEKIRMALIHYFSHPENTSFEYWEAIPKSKAIAWLEKQGQKPTWSKDDEIFVHGLIRGLSAKRDIHGHTAFGSDYLDITETIDWLRTLKDRLHPQWKPSEEQLNALDEVYKTHSANNVCRRIIFNLLEQLKKL